MLDEYVTLEHISLGNTRLLSLRFSIHSITSMRLLYSTLKHMAFNLQLVKQSCYKNVV
jgi:hypothetical protein